MLELLNCHFEPDITVVRVLVRYNLCHVVKADHYDSMATLLHLIHVPVGEIDLWRRKITAGDIKNLIYSTIRRLFYIFQSKGDVTIELALIYLHPATAS